MRKTMIPLGIFSTIAIIIIVYFIAFFDTNSLVQHIGEVMRCEVPYEESQGKPEKRYNMTGRLSGSYRVSEFELNRLFVLHNFFDGYIWVNYRIEIVDENGESIYGGIASSCWKIHKENGVWQIVEIYEKP